LSLKILITGGLGFVGGRLANHLLQKGHNVVIGSRNKEKPPILLSRAKVVKIDYDDQEILENFCSGIDVIIHAAGMNSKASFENSGAAFKFNGELTSRLVMAANSVGVTRFIYLSTAHVYSSFLVGEINEQTPTKNTHPYAISNLMGENSVTSNCSFGNTEGIVLRLSNTFGYPVVEDSNCWTLLVNDLCRQAVEIGKLTLRSSKLEERDFIGLKNICNIIEYFSTNKDALIQGEVFNIGSGISYSILEIAKIVQSRCFLVLGFLPELKLINKNLANNQIKFKLKFNIDKLRLLDINTNEITEEIDSLLLYCKKNFDKTMPL